MKIALIGYSGSGKSSTAEELGKMYNIPVLFMDTVFWRENWQKRDTEKAKKIIYDFMDSNSDWVIDGNYKAFYRRERLEAADMILFFNFNRFNCLWRAFKRWITYRGKTRPSITAGCDEKFDFEFILWILWEGRTEERRTDYKNICNKYKNKTIVLKNQSQLDEFLGNQKKI